MFRISDLSFGFRDGKEIFQNVELVLNADKLVLLTGENGCGKTTFCRLLSGLITQYQGVIKLQEDDLRKLKPAEIAERVTYLKQESLANIVAATPNEDLSIWKHKFGAKNSDQQQEIDSALYRYGLDKISEKPVWELSSGQKKRLNLSALLLNPDKYWIIDEPYAGLDSDAKSTFRDMLIEKKRSNTGGLIITHHKLQSDFPADQYLIIENKQIKVL